MEEDKPTLVTVIKNMCPGMTWIDGQSFDGGTDISAERQVSYDDRKLVHIAIGNNWLMQPLDCGVYNNGFCQADPGRKDPPRCRIFIQNFGDPWLRFVDGEWRIVNTIDGGVF